MNLLERFFEFWSGGAPTGAKELAAELVRLGNDEAAAQVLIKAGIVNMFITRRPAGRDSFDVLTVTARVPGTGEVAGLLQAVQMSPFYVDVHLSSVTKPYRRLGLGTALYRRAAFEICDIFDVPLRSKDYQRGVMAEGVWAKELEQGHVHRVAESYSYDCPVHPDVLDSV